MPNVPSLWSFIANAGPIVKLVIFLLFIASLVSWTMILQRWFFLRRAKKAIQEFEGEFWAGTDLIRFYQELNKNRNELSGLEQIFHAGFSEFLRLHKQGGASTETILENADRAMRVALAREMDELEKHLSFLATVGSTSPYVGLFGTVWGIMTSFRALGGVSQATIAMVAPGISEALIATAMGLFAAIPAVIAYNRYANLVERIANHYATFQEEFANILHRHVLQKQL